MGECLVKLYEWYQIAQRIAYCIRKCFLFLDHFWLLFKIEDKSLHHIENYEKIFEISKCFLLTLTFIS